MFKKTITRLAYSPALAEELSNYARRLRREESKRQIGLIFIILALTVQSFAVLFPPESANAGNGSDFIEGGFSTIDEYLGHYDQNTHNIKDLLSSLGVSRIDIQSMRAGKLETTEALSVWKMAGRGGAEDTAYEFIKSDGTSKTAYFQSLGRGSKFSREASSPQSDTAFIGSSVSIGWFALLKSSGNLVTATPRSGSCPSRTSLLADAPVPVSLSDINRCDLKLIPALTAQNLTADTSATSRSAQASDRIIYTLTVTNDEDYTMAVPLSIGLTDIMEYAQLIDRGGAFFNQESRTLTWATVTIPPGSTVTRSFIVKLLPVIPSTATGQNNSSSYDCVVSGSFGNTTLRVPVSCPLPKVIEQTAANLPHLSMKANIIFAAVISSIAAYFYVRSKQLRTELRLIRHNNHGSL